MSETQRHDAAKLLRSYRATIRRYTQAAAGKTGSVATIQRDMAMRYREALAGACDMLATLEGR